MYWTDYLSDTIYSSDFSGDNVREVVNTQLDVPGIT